MSDLTLEQRVEHEPWGLIVEALVLQAKGEPMPDDLADAAEAAATLLAAAALVKAGADADDVLRQFEERDHTIRLNYDADGDEIGLTIDWSDGGSTEVKGVPHA